MAVESQDDVLSLLHKVQLAASDDTLAGACFQLRALLPKCNGSESLVELSSLLMHSPQYYRIAVSLIRFILQGLYKKEQSDALEQYVNSRLKYETNKSLPTLQLRVLLVIIAAQSDADDIEAFMSHFAYVLEMNPDRFKASSDYCSMLKLFEELIVKEKFGADGNDLSELRNVLKSRRKDLIKKYLEDFSTLREYTLAVMNVELKVASDLSKPAGVSSELGTVTYRKLLINAYKAMPDIPIGQWPPIKKVHYINLALITSDPMPRNDYFSRATVRGSIDDVMMRKVPTTYESVFSSTKSQRRMLVLIEGRPACGKSTLLTKVSKDWANGKILCDMQMLVLVRLRQCLGKKKLSLEDIFGQRSDDSEQVSAVINEVTKTDGEGLCLVLDGLDEYGPANNLKSKNLITKLLVGELLPNVSIITASRPAGSVSIRRSPIKLSKHVEIIGFLDEQIRAYVEHAFEEGTENIGKASRLLKYLREHPNVARMCYLPLHLAMVVYLFDQGQELPDAETDLYYNFTLHTLHRSFIRTKVVSDDDDEDDDEDDVEMHDLSRVPPEKEPIFQSICLLAFRATTDQKQIFTGKDIMEMEDMKLPVRYEKKAFDSLGLLTVDRITAESLLSTKSFSFLHLTLQEFLSACYLLYYCDEAQQLDIIRSPVGRFDHMWVVWKFYCGLSRKPRVNSSPSSFRKAFQEISDGVVSSRRRIASLNMVHCAFESKNIGACMDLVTRLDGRMDVNDITLTPSDCAAVGKVTSNAHSLVKEIDLSYCHIGPDGIGALTDQLENTLEAVQLFRLRARIDRPVGTEGAPFLSKMLQKLPNLEELRLYGNKLKTIRFQYLVPIIRDMTKLQTFIVSRNDLDSGSHVSDILENLPHLHTFYISYNPIKDIGLGEMKPGLLKCKELTILGLRQTSLTGESGVHLKEIFETLPNLATVELYQNRLGDKGVIDMLPGLRKATTLKTMSLVENEIGDRGALALANFLEFTHTLVQLRIYYNHEMTDVGKTALRSAVVNRTAELTERCDLRVAV